MPSVLVEKVTKNYRDVRALNEVSLNLQEPGCIGILGPNGAGKTTLLKILTNIVKPTEGVALLNGINVSDEPEKALMDVGALVEQPEFYPYLTALETLKFVGRVKGVTEKNLNSELQRVSRMTGIVEYLGRKTGNFSRGMKQRLSLACALISDPHIIILDEPTFGLDPKGMKEMRDLIKSLNQSKERIIILSTHLIYEAQEICDRVIIINKGEIVHDTINSPSENIIEIEFEDPAGKVSLPDHMADQTFVDGKSAMFRLRSGTSNSDVINYLSAQGFRIRWVKPQTNLENLYITLTSS